jgi:D-glycero-alpha-D-manno-heptose-7-phosphate kinase
MIISKTPFRISFVGGGSDLSEFYLQYGGAVISTTIDKYIYLSMHNYFEKNKSLLKYSETELVTNNNQIKHKIIKAVFDYFSISNVDFNSTADIPSGTGMGSSSAFTCGLINLCLQYKNLIMTSNEVADLACNVEINILKEPIGKQDQYACSVGGLNLISFSKDNTVEIKKIDISNSNLEQIQKNLFLYYTNLNRKASDILTEQKINTKSETKSINNLIKMTQMAYDLEKSLKCGSIDDLGFMLNESWQLKKQLASNISNNTIDELYEFGINSGAIGGKLLGAGGGGFVLFYVKEEKHKEFKIKMSKNQELDFCFEKNGSQIIYNSK